MRRENQTGEQPESNDAWINKYYAAYCQLRGKVFTNTEKPLILQLLQQQQQATLPALINTKNPSAYHVSVNWQEAERMLIRDVPTYLINATILNKIIEIEVKAHEQINMPMNFMTIFNHAFNRAPNQPEAAPTHTDTIKLAILKRTILLKHLILAMHGCTSHLAEEIKKAGEHADINQEVNRVIRVIAGDRLLEISTPEVIRAINDQIYASFLLTPNELKERCQDQGITNTKVVVRLLFMLKNLAVYAHIDDELLACIKTEAEQAKLSTVELAAIAESEVAKSQQTIDTALNAASNPEKFVNDLMSNILK